MNWPALTLAFRLGCRSAWGETFAILGNIVLFTAVTLSFGELLRKVPADDVVRLHLTQGRLVWYVVLTQFAARGMNFGQDVQDMVKSGAVEVAMLRPASFWSLILAGWSGRLCIQALCLLPPAAALGFDLGGAFPAQGYQGLLVVSCLACLLCGQCVAFMIGCSTLWLGEGGPVVWITQKLTLILGGMLCPIVFYPHWLQSVAWATPFPAFAAITGGFALNHDSAQTAVALGLQIVWTGLMLAACAGLTHLMHRKIARPA